MIVGAGVSLAVKRFGAGTPVVLVHGSAGGLDSWDPVLPFLESRYEVWVYARRGYAPSGRGASPKTFADDVADLAAVLGAVGSPAHVVGGSYGAVAGLHAAGLPGVLSLSLFEPPLFAAGPDLVPVLAGYRELVAAGKLTKASLLFAEKVARVPAAMLAALAAETAATETATTTDKGEQGTKAPRPTSETVRDSGTAAASEEAAAEAIGCLHDLEAMAADSLDLRRWSTVSLPTLLLQGGETWEPMPSTMDALAAALPRLTRVTLPGQAHFATHTAPGLFAAALLDFLAAH
jgi:pimeloyl-ACP methyl ester carboxylesterase